MGICSHPTVSQDLTCQCRNPWGKKEWDGPWSDGSEQWTLEWMKLLGHKFGNDGVWRLKSTLLSEPAQLTCDQMFWISYKDLLRKYQHFDRTRLFGPEWTITQQWTCLDVDWSADYHETKFSISLTKTSAVVIVLSQVFSYIGPPGCTSDTYRSLVGLTIF